MRRTGIVAIVMVAAITFIPGTAGATGRANIGQITMTGTCQSATSAGISVGAYATNVERVTVPTISTPRHPRPFRYMKRVTALAFAQLTPNTTYQLYIVSNFVDSSGVVTGCAATTDAPAIFTTNASGNGGAVYTTDLDATRQYLSIAICNYDPSGFTNCIGQPSGWSSPLQRV